MRGWIDERLGLSALRAGLLDKPIGSHIGWSQTLGAVALFLFLLQAATGVVLAFYYVPSPEQAYTAVSSVEQEVPLGGLLRGLHRWGASLMVVAVVVHLCRSFVHGAYKAPREITWMAGVGLLVLTFAFGFTGYLLPWDQRAFWATVVGQQILATVPLVGEVLVGALGGREVGGATLSRFFVLHIVLLPAATVAFLALHLYLVQRHGVAGPPRPGTGPSRPFYPFHAVKDLLACLAVFGVALGLAAGLGAPLEEVADPTDTAYLPRPEWYFLFLYELLKFFKGSAMIVGTVLLPLAGLALVLLLPLLDRSAERRLARRPLALALGLALATGLSYLTVVAASSTPRPGVFLAPPAPLTPRLSAGMALFEEKGCPSCHSILGKGMKLAPDLYRVGARRDREWLSRLLTDPRAVFPAPSMVKYSLAPDDLAALVAYLDLLDLTAGAREVPRRVVAGGAAAYRRGCLACHRIGAEGAAGGVPLDGVGKKRDDASLTIYLRGGGGGHPPTASPLTEAELAPVVAYVRGL